MRKISRGASAAGWRLRSPRVFLPRVLGSHAKHERADRVVDPWASGTALGVAIVLLGDELTIPAQDRVGGDDAGDLAKGLSAQGFALGSQATTLSGGEAKTTPFELLAEYTVLLLEAGDEVLLSPVKPAGKGQQGKLQGSRWGLREGESGP